MEPLSGAASVITVVQITGQILGLCQTYYTAVKSAREDIQRLRDELQALNFVLTKLADILDEPETSQSLALQDLSNGTFRQCQDDLQGILTTLDNAQGHSKMSALSLRSLKWPLKSKEVDKAVSIVERYKSTFTLAVNADILSLGQTTRKDVQALQQQFAATRSDMVALQKAEIRSKIAEWLAAPDPSSNFELARRKHEAATSTWFTQGSQFLHWMDQNSSFYWLYGLPGSGKTILSSSAIRSLQAHTEYKLDCVVVYFYFSFMDDAKKDPQCCIRSLLKQVLLQHDAACSLLQSLHSRCRDGALQPDFDSLLEVMQQIVPTSAHTYIVIDALDECVNRDELLQLLNTIQGWKYANLHVFVTSRREKDIVDSLQGLTSGECCLQDEAGTNDIQPYVRRRLICDSKLRKWSPQLHEEIETALLAKAGGMFRWVVCQLDSLSKCLRETSLRAALSSLPKTLDETYERMLTSIDEEYTEDAYNVLQWLCFSARPLQLKEINEAVAITTGKGGIFDPSKRLRDADDILLLCPSLIDISHSLVARLAHFSVKEYLESSRIREGPAWKFSIISSSAHRLIATGCLIYLSQFDEEGSITKDSAPDYPLALYAAKNWTKHFRSSDASHESDDLALLGLDFLENPHLLANCLKLHNPDYLPMFTITSTQSALYYAASAGLDSLIPILLARGANINCSGGLYGNSLQVSIYRKHIPIAKQLILNGADVHQKGGYFGNALLAAIEIGSLEMVQLLIQQGADADTIGNSAVEHAIGITRQFVPLYKAARAGHLEIVKVLVSHGAEVNRRSASRCTALGRAASSGHYNVVDYLLRNGAVVTDDCIVESALRDLAGDLAGKISARGASVMDKIKALQIATSHSDIT